MSTITITYHDPSDGAFAAVPIDVEVESNDPPAADDSVVTFSLAERRALRLLARAGLLPTLPRREAG